MSVVVILIALSILVASGFLIAFIWAVRTDQYKDTVSPAIRMLFDDSAKNVETLDHQSTIAQTPHNPKNDLTSSRLDSKK